MAPTTINQERRLDYSLQPSQTYYEGSSTGRVSLVLDPHFPAKCFLFLNHKFPAIDVSLFLSSFFSSDYISLKFHLLP